MPDGGTNLEQQCCYANKSGVKWKTLLKQSGYYYVPMEQQNFDKLLRKRH